MKKRGERTIKKDNHPMFSIPRTFGQKASDIITKWVGSWIFISLIVVFILGWIYLNITAYLKHWDPWPFIILNLCLSSLAAIQGPIILMSHNRSSEKDRQRIEYDYDVDKKAEKEIQTIKKQLDRIESQILKKKL